jgi:hypothetical protein
VRRKVYSTCQTAPRSECGTPSSRHERRMASLFNAAPSSSRCWMCAVCASTGAGGTMVVWGGAGAVGGGCAASGWEGTELEVLPFFFGMVAGQRK